MMGTTQVNLAKQLIATKLVLREVEIKTPSYAGTGGKYEHPAKDKIEYANPIDKIFEGAGSARVRMYFGNKNGDKTPIKSLF